MTDWMKHKVDSRFQGEILITSELQMTVHLWQKVKRNKKLLDEGEKSWLTTFKQLRSWHPVPSSHADKWGSNENSVRIYFLGL